MSTRVAIVGLGRAALDIWVPALNKARVTLVAGADPDLAAQQAFARVAPASAPHPSLPELLDSHHSIDWLVVASPPTLHQEHVLAGLDAGVHVLCEKPVARSTSDVDALLEAAAAAGKTVAVNHEFTRMPILAETLSRLHAETHGRLRFAQIWQVVDDRGANGWRARGRTMREFGTHAVDLLIQAYGGPPAQVTARMPTPPPGMQGDPIDLVTYEWADGRAAHLVLDRVSAGKHRYFEARFDCDQASLRTSIGGRAQVRVGLNPATRRPGFQLDVAPGGLAWTEDANDRSVYARNGLHALVDATAQLARETFGSSAPPTELSRARIVVQAVQAAYQSAREDRTVRILI